MNDLMRMIVMHLLKEYVFPKIKSFEDKIGNEAVKEIIESITAGIEEFLTNS